MGNNSRVPTEVIATNVTLLQHFNPLFHNVLHEVWQGCNKKFKISSILLFFNFKAESCELQETANNDMKQKNNESFGSFKSFSYFCNDKT